MHVVDLHGPITELSGDLSRHWCSNGGTVTALTNRKSAGSPAAVKTIWLVKTFLRDSVLVQKQRKARFALVAAPYRGPRSGLALPYILKF